MYNNQSCNRCGRESSPTDKFCQGCGAAIIRAESSTANQNIYNGAGTEQGGFYETQNNSSSPQGGFVNSGDGNNRIQGSFGSGQGNFNSQQGGFYSGQGNFGSQQGGFGAPVGGYSPQSNSFGGQPNQQQNGFYNQSGYNQDGYNSGNTTDEKMQKFAFISSFFSPAEYKYLEQLTNYIEGRRCKFNWAAAFFAGPWMAFRKMNLKAYLYTLGMNLIALFAALIVVFVFFSESIQVIAYGYFDERALGFAMIGFLAVLLGFFLFFGFNGYKIYFNRLNSLFYKFRNVDRGFMPVLHNKYGGTSPLFLIIYIVIIVILGNI